MCREPVLGRRGGVGYIGAGGLTHPGHLGRQATHCYAAALCHAQGPRRVVRLVRAEKMVLSGLVFARKIASIILIQNI